MGLRENMVFRKEDLDYRWTIVAACFIGSMVVYGISYSFGVFFDPLLTEFGANRGRTSLVFGLHTFMLYIGAVAVGRLVDKYGVRRLLFTGTILFGVGLFWTSQAQSLQEFLLSYSVITSLGLSIIYVVSYATIPRWFTERRGFAGGIASSGLGVGMLIIAPGAEYVIETTSWQTAYIVICAFLVSVLLVATLLIREPPEDRAETPSKTQQRSETDTSTLHTITATLSLKSFQLVFLGWALIYTTLFVVFVNLPVYASDTGLTTQVGAFALGIIGATSIVSRLTIGLVSDRVGRARSFAWSSAIMGVSTLFLPFIETTYALYLVACAYGIGYGGNGALLSPLTADLFGTGNINTNFGLTSMSFAVSGLLTPYIAGIVYETQGTYAVIFLASGILAVIGSGFILVAGRIAPNQS